MNRLRTQPQIKGDLKNEHDLKNEDNLKNEDDFKNEDDLKNEEDLKKEDNLKNEDNIKNKTWSSVSNSSLSKTFVLGNLESLKFRSSVLSIQRSFGSEKILGLKKI